MFQKTNLELRTTSSDELESEIKFNLTLDMVQGTCGSQKINNFNRHMKKGAQLIRFKINEKLCLLKEKQLFPSLSLQDSSRTSKP